MKILRDGSGTYVNVKNLISTLQNTINELENLKDQETLKEVDVKIETLTETIELLNNLEKI